MRALMPNANETNNVESWIKNTQDESNQKHVGKNSMCRERINDSQNNYNNRKMQEAHR